MERTRILAIGVDKVTMHDALSRCRDFIQAGVPHLVFTPNAEIAYAATQDPELAAVINQADLVIPDGAGVVLASRVLGDPVPQKVAGADLATNLVRDLARQGGKVYLIGGRPEVVAEAARKLTSENPGITVYYHDGFFAPEEERRIIADIRARGPQALFVGLGSPRQERWLTQHKSDLNVPVCMGVGGTIDVWAGVAKRAPEWMIDANLEWLFRVVKFGRYGRSLPPLAKFVLKVLAQRMRGESHASRPH